MKNSHKIENLGILTARYGLVIVLVWIGAMKFTSYEAEGIKPLVENSPLMAWMYSFMSVQGFSNALGAVEILVGIMIALRPVLPTVSAAGSAFAVVMFLTTLTFLITTPGWEANMGFPALSVAPGQFVLKDIVLLGVSLWLTGEALRNSRCCQSD